MEEEEVEIDIMRGDIAEMDQATGTAAGVREVLEIEIDTEMTGTDRSVSEMVTNIILHCISIKILFLRSQNIDTWRST